MRGFVAWRQTPQKVDPVMVGAVFPLIGITSLGMIVYAIVQTTMRADEIVWPVLAIASIALLVVALLVVLVSTDPVTSPTPFVGFVVAVVTVNLANLASALSTWGASTSVWDGWAPVAVAVVVVCFGEFRTGRDLAAATLFSALMTGAIGVAESTVSPEAASPWTAGVVAATPVVVLGVAASVFSYRVSLNLSRGREAHARERNGLSRRVRIRLRELMRDSGREALGAELVPYIEGILERGEVTGADNAEARRLSAVLRSVIIADMGLPWLQRMQRAHPSTLRVHDDNHLADSFTMERKVALRALITTLLDELDGVGDGPGEPLHVRINAVGPQRSVFLRLPYRYPEHLVRRRLGSFITVMAAVFGRSNVTLVDGELRLLFAYHESASGTRPGIDAGLR